MTQLTLPLWIFACHWFCDWALQSNWMALGKSKRLTPLLVHSVVATSYLLLAGWWRMASLLQPRQRRGNLQDGGDCSC